MSEKADKLVHMEDARENVLAALLALLQGVGQLALALERHDMIVPGCRNAGGYLTEAQRRLAAAEVYAEMAKEDSSAEVTDDGS